MSRVHSIKNADFISAVRALIGSENLKMNNLVADAGLLVPNAGEVLQMV